MGWGQEQHDCQASLELHASYPDDGWTAASLSLTRLEQQFYTDDMDSLVFVCHKPAWDLHKQNAPLHCADTASKMFVALKLKMYI